MKNKNSRGRKPQRRLVEALPRSLPKAEEENYKISPARLVCGPLARDSNRKLLKLAQ